MTDIVRTETWERNAQRVIAEVRADETVVVTVPILHEMLADLGYRQVVRPASVTGAAPFALVFTGEECGAIDIANCAVHGYGGTSDLRGPRALPLPVPKREAATYELSDDARPCCHTTGPHHHPACQEAKQ